MMVRLPPVDATDTGAVLRIPDTPKSLNRVGQRGTWRATHFEKKRWQDIIEKYLMMARLPRPLPRRVRVRAVLQFPTAHRRDEGNYRSPLEKAMGDALVNGGWITDDTPEWWTFDDVEFHGQRGPATTVIIMDWRHEGV